jgi:octaprenyl-diphosphate synthase
VNSSRLAADRDHLQGLYAPIGEPLQQVEEILGRELSHSDPYVDGLLRYGCLLGGKRLRPALLLLTGQALGRLNDAHRLLAAVVEMIHTATLIHDDVLDQAQTRRHLATVNSRWDNHASILLGDYLFSQAFYLASTLESTRACQLIGQATNRVCAGEMRQKGSCGDFSLSEEDYLEIIAAKTAELCAVSCELGAAYAGEPHDRARQWADYGRWLGIAFQIVDDVLDLQGDEGTIGKSLGTDLQQGIPTLPLIWLLENGGEAERRRITAALHDPLEDSRQIVLPLLRSSGALDYAMSRAATFADQARAMAASLAPSPAAAVLQRLPQFVIARSM